jgi:hypothetical protein
LYSVKSRPIVAGVPAGDATAEERAMRSVDIFNVLVSSVWSRRGTRDVMARSSRASGTEETYAEIAAAITSLGCEPRGGLVVMPDGFTSGHRS